MLAPSWPRVGSMGKISSSFRRFAEATARCAGKPAAFLAAAALVLAWAATGPLFGFGDTWQLVINTGTTIITFLMVFLIQNSQNRDSAALQIKLDELIRATAARNDLLDVENLDEDALERIRDNYRKLAARRARDKAAHSGGRAQEAAQERDEACQEVRDIERELRAQHAAEAAARKETAGTGDEPSAGRGKDGELPGR